MRPGTVSKILWHFTGGPKWNSTTNKQLTELKPAIDGYNALKSIISSTELRVGSYQEIVKIILAEKRRYNLTTRSHEIQKDVAITVKSKPVCCVADIPLQHLAYHAKRYGKIAIGFRREAILKAAFNPVMYTLENSALLNSIYTGYNSISDVDPASIEIEVKNFTEEVERKFDEHGVDDYIYSHDFDFEIEYAKKAQSKLEQSYCEFLAYIKTFNTTEFDSIYCEREWRSTKSFKFSLDDIALIILPTKQEGFEFYSDFLDRFTLPRNITVARWEDLVEH